MEIRVLLEKNGQSGSLKKASRDHPAKIKVFNTFIEFEIVKKIHLEKTREEVMPKSALWLNFQIITAAHLQYPYQGYYSILILGVDGQAQTKRR